MTEAEQVLMQALAADPALAGIARPAVLRARAGRIVAESVLDGVPVILKLFTGPAAAQTVRALAAEHARLAHLTRGPLQVPRCLIASPDAGLAVLSRQPGEPLSHLLRVVQPEERARLLAAAGALLLAYGAGRHSLGTFGPAHWLRRVDAMRPAPPFAGALRAALGRQAARLGGAALCRSAVHGDFVPVNLLADAQTLSAIDFQGEAVMPLSHDVACLLAWLAIDHPPAGPHWLGVPAADRAAVLSAGLPVAGEDPGILRFLLGVQIARRLSEGMAGAPAAARRYLADVDRLE